VRAPAADSPTGKVLVVDDDDGNRVALEEVLAPLGGEVVAAASGADALRAVLRHDFAVILLDVRMPGMDGYETAELIRQRERSRHVPIIFLSGIDKDVTHQFRGYAAGAVDYVLKPVEPLILRSKVAVFLQLWQQRQEMRRTAEAERRLLAENLAVRAREADVARALEQSLAEQSLVLDTLPVVLFTCPVDHPERRHFVGGKVEALTGPRTCDDAAGESWSDCVHPDDRPRLAAAVADGIAGGTYSIEYRIGAGDGARWVHEQGQLRPDREGTPRLYGVISDVTERKRLEEQLTHAQKLDAIGQLSGGVAHDFNNMLGVIIGSLDRVLATASGLDERSRQRLDLALQAANSCADLTKRLLGFARRQALMPRRIDIGAEIDRLRGLFDRVLGELVEVAIEVDEGLPPVYLDASQFEGAIVNLMVNARDAMPEGGRLTITARTTELGPDEAKRADAAPGRYIELVVSDTGTGMDAATLARAFEPFFTTKAPGRGTGLGLSSIYGFLRQSGGGMWIESAPGQGTAMHLFLPPGEVPDDEPPGAATLPDADAFCGLRVALVEDNDRVREISRALLEELGCVVSCHVGGDEAAAAVDPAAIDLLVTDCVMPGGLDGPGLARRLRERRGDLPVLFVSGFLQNADPLPSGRATLLAKPFNLQQLARALAALWPAAELAPSEPAAGPAR